MLCSSRVCRIRRTGVAILLGRRSTNHVALYASLEVHDFIHDKQVWRCWGRFTAGAWRFVQDNDWYNILADTSNANVPFETIGHPAYGLAWARSSEPLQTVQRVEPGTALIVKARAQSVGWGTCARVGIRERDDVRVILAEVWSC